MYLRRCSMSSISEESETGDDEEMIQKPQQKKLNVENCLGDLNNFKEVKICHHSFSI
jgi:hypothetical protein